MAATKLTDKLTAVADAIRNKTGNTEKLTLDQMPEEIAGIKTGGGGGDYNIDDVTFYDYDGTIIYSCSMGDAQNLTELPTPPEHKGLVFQGWNWTLEQIKSSSVGADVGALYDTEDGALVFNIEVTNKIERENISLRFSTVTGGVNPPHIAVDWGDGQNEISTNTVEGDLDVTHAYSANGKYAIRVTKSSKEEDDFAISIRNSTGYQLISDGMSIDNIIDSVYIGSDCGEVNANTFAGTNVIRHVTVHKDLVLPNTSALFSSNTGGIRCLVLPPAQKNLYGILGGCESIKTISIPPTVIAGSVGRPNGLFRIVFPDSINTVESSGSNNSRLKDIRFGNQVWKIDSYAFSNPENCISELYLPASLIRLESSCFTGMTNMKAYHLKSETPPTLASAKSLAINTFGSEKTKICVPNGCGDTYKAATNWAALADYIVEEEE